MLDPVLSKDALIMPCKGILKACAMSLPVSCSCIHNFVLSQACGDVAEFYFTFCVGSLEKSPLLTTN